MPTISPDYMMKGISNPYYNVDTVTNSSVTSFLRRKKVAYKELLYKCVYKGNGESIPNSSKGKYVFQIVNKNQQRKEIELPYYINLTAKQIKGHYGMATRKDSTASSNVNEFLTVYFLKNKYPGAKEFMEYCSDPKIKSRSTGVLKGEGTPVTYGELNMLIDKDETPERDIKIGYQNSVAVFNDIKGKKTKKLFWVPRAKPPGVAANNPSDVVVQFDDDSYFGYSNKIASKTDATPKFNTSVTAFYSKLESRDASQMRNIKKIIDDSWNQASKTIPETKSSAYNAIKNFKIESQAFSESTSKTEFANLAKEFKKDNLDFYANGFYYLFRNQLIKNVGNYLMKSENLAYFLNTVYSYTYGTPSPNEVPCPYKLLIGRENAESELKSVSDNNDLKNVLMVEDNKKLKNIKFVYDGTSQSFKINFDYDKFSVEMPITCRTRAAGGWSGKSLFMNTPGLKVK
jgi:hypothetical protein